MKKSRVLILLFLLWTNAVSAAKTTTHRNYIGNDCYVTEITIYENSGNSSTYTKPCKEYDAEQEEKKKWLEKHEKQKDFQIELKSMQLLDIYNAFEFSTAKRPHEIKRSALFASALVEKFNTVKSLRDFTEKAFLSGYRSTDIYPVYVALDKMVKRGYGSSSISLWEGSIISSCLGEIGLLTVEAYHNGKPVLFGITNAPQFYFIEGDKLKKIDKIIDDYCKKNK